MRILITGVAGFIGFSCARKFLEKNIKVVGIDNLDNYYSIKLKKQRIKILKKYKKFQFIKLDIIKAYDFKKLKNFKFTHALHFAAQPGVRYSLVNPKKYYETNIKGFINVVESLNTKNLKKFIYASSSSVYGDQKKFPTNETSLLKSKNPYGLSKIINEELSEIFSKIKKFNFIGLRFFTVYGEWGRPDMFIIKLLNSIKKNKTFFLNNNGNHFRDFTYINDISEACYKLLKYKTKENHIIFNICAGKKVNIKKLTRKIKSMFSSSKIKNIKANKADVYQTFGDNKKIVKALNIKKFNKIDYGLKRTVEWFIKNKRFNLI